MEVEEKEGVEKENGWGMEMEWSVRHWL